MRLAICFLLCFGFLFAQDIHIRTNIIGYFPEDTKVALIMAKDALKGKAELISEEGESVLKKKI